METKQVTYRTLIGNELEELLPTLQRIGWSIPHPELATGQVAEVDGKIVGFVITQLVPHAEPEWVDVQYRGTGIAEELANRAIETLRGGGAKGILTVAQNEFSEKLCESVGMKPIPGKLYRLE